MLCIINGRRNISLCPISILVPTLHLLSLSVRHIVPSLAQLGYQVVNPCFASADRLVQHLVLVLIQVGRILTEA